MKNASSEIRAIFKNMEAKRIKFYCAMVEDTDAFADWSISVERIIAYRILLRNLKLEGEEFKKSVEKKLRK